MAVELFEPTQARIDLLVGKPFVDADIAVGANINADKIGTGVVDNTEFNRLNGITSAIEEQGNKGAISGYAGLDASQELLLINFPAGTGLQVLRRNAGNTALEFSTPAAGSDTPWTEDHDADGFDLNDLSNLEFRTTTGAPAITIRAIWYDDAIGMRFNALTGDIYRFDVNGVSQMTINATTIDFEGNTLTDILDITSITSLNGIAITNYALSTDNLGFFAATTSLQLLGVISDETGSGLLVFGTSPTIVTPTIASFVNATHSHLNAAGGGTITKAAISDTPWAKADIPATTVYTDQINTFGAFLNSFVSSTMRIPLSATPTMAVDGDFAIDTTITDFSMGLIKYFDGEEMIVVSIPVAETVTPTGGHVITYNATNDEFELVAQTGGSQTPWVADIDADGFDLFDLSNILFRTTTGAPIATDRSIHYEDTEGMVFNALTGDFYQFEINAVNEMRLTATELNLQNNKLANVNPTTITDFTTVTAVSGDFIWIIDATDGLSKKVDANDFLGGASQTPWTSDIDADGFDLNDLSNILFRTTTGAPTATDRSIHYEDTEGMVFNALTGDFFQLEINAVQEYRFTATQADFNSNNVVNMGTLNTHTIQGGTDTFVMRDTTDTLTNKTFDLTDNTITGTKAEFDTALSDDDFAYIGQANVFTQNQEIEITGAIPILTFDRPEVLADNTTITRIDFRGFDDASATEIYAQIRVVVASDAAANPDGCLDLRVDEAGTLKNYITLNDLGGADIDLHRPVNFNSQNVSNMGTLNTHTVPGGTSTFALVSDNLSVFAATTSAQLAGVISDETGSGLLVFGTSPTIVTPTIASFVNATHGHTAASSGGTLLSTAALSDTADITYLNTANTFIAGNKNTFAHSATTAGIGVLPIAGNPSGQADGDLWLNVTTQQLFARINGANVDLGAAAGGSQTPWTSDIDADGFDLTDLSNILFRTTTGAPTTTDRAIHYDDAEGMVFNALTGDVYRFEINGVLEAQLSATVLDLQNNDLILGTGNLKFSGTQEIFDGGGGALVINTGAGDVIDFRVGGITQWRTIDGGIAMQNRDITLAGNIFLSADETHQLDLTRATAQADGYVIGEQRFRHDDALGVLQNYARIIGVMESDVDPEDGSLQFFVTEAGVHDVLFMALNDASAGRIDILKDATMAAGKNLELLASGALGLITMGELTTPATPTGNTGSYYVKDVGTVSTAFFIGDDGVEKNLTTGVGDDLGDHTATQALDLNTQILQFIDANQTITNNAGNLIYDVATGQVHLWRINNVTEMQLSATALDLQNNSLIMGSGIIQFRSLDVSIAESATNDLIYDVANTKEHIFRVNDVTEMELSGASLTLSAGNNLVIQASGATGFIDIGEITVPANPATNFGRLYTKDVGGTHSELFYRDELGTETNVLTGTETTTWTADHNAAGFDLLNVGGIQINNPADTFQYIITPAAIAADRIVNLPLLTGTDTITMDAFAATLTNKTLGTGTVFSVIPTINDGITFTFNPNATIAGINVGAQAGDPSTLVDGDIWYNSTTNKIRTRQNGISEDLVSGGGAITFTDAVLCTMEVPEGTVAFPDVHALATASNKVDGFVLPDGASTSTIDFKCRVPRDIATTPAMKIRIRFMTQAADSDHAVRLTVSTIGLAVNENFDAALTAETEITAECPNATETGNEATIEVDLTTDWAADDTVLGQLKRDPTDAVDDYAGDILIVGIELLVDRTIS